MKIIRTIIKFLLFMFLKSINCQFTFTYLSNVTLEVMENCKLKGENGVKQFSDCEPASNYTNNQVCCYIYGNNLDGTNYRGCIAMSVKMFANKTLSYESETISGTLICDKNYNYGNYNKNSIAFYLYIFISIILF